MTIVHGFFLSMGGFVRSTDFGISPIPAHHAGREVKSDDLRRVHEREISDRSKGDELTKGLAIIQTGWFVVQCIARGATGLHITELEVVTLSFASLNLMTYIIWWNKPLDVRCPIQIGTSSGAPDVPKDKGTAFARRKAKTNVPNIPQQENKSTRSVSGSIWYSVFSFFVGETEKAGLPRGSTRVPIMWAGRLDSKSRGNAWVAAALIATAFGAIHFIAWAYSSPESDVERILWRAASIAVTSLPVAFVADAAFILKVDVPPWYTLITSKFVLPLGVSLYIGARVLLLVLSFASLRSLPPDAFEDVWWTTYLPHI